MPYDTSVLDQALAERHAEWERRRVDTLATVLTVLQEVLPQFGVDEAYVFGSLAQRGRYHAGSDIDVAVQWKGRSDFFDMAAEVSRRLGQDIDILPLEQIHFADKIRREGIRWTRATTA
ncbi:nucleotidyltransferase family protein [Promineifilum sp.]|uniref:nucleotidyltransferase family protein n=1 Tax=Promineifilum sp. TaxID=2664178 RepID=UPI0035AE7A47